ncbi:fluoride efflux transporter CrcB [Streptomyces sp. BI20]|uniref:fluoride efflux transporter CrcB n=1 Tax=Streptomyces sp. BI20 TaxID=3403460 RepID=UPI003C71E956
MTWLAVVLGAMLGAPARYLTDRLVRARYEGPVPWGTFAVNVVGSLLLGAITATVTRGAGPGLLGGFAGVGFCGALTTYSTFSYELLRLFERGRSGLALAYGLGSALCGFGAAWAGFLLAGG